MEIRRSIMRIYRLIVFIIAGLCSIYAENSRETVKKTGEKWFDWNGSSWVQREYHDFELDSLGSTTRLVKYFYNESGVGNTSHIYSRTDYNDYYTLRFRIFNSWFNQGGYSSYELIRLYRYDLSDVKIGYTVSEQGDYEDWSSHFTKEDSYSYNYEGESISSIEESHFHQENSYIFADYDCITNFDYDEHNRITLESKLISYDKETWQDRERTVWNYEGSTGTGINEIYKNTVWIFQNKKTRTLDASYDPSFENRNVWSWGYWINSQTDNLYYNALSNLYDTQTKLYNSSTGTYTNYKRHYIYFETFTEPLTAPVNFTSSLSDANITLTWDPVSGATGYNIYSSAEPYGTFSIDTSGTLIGTQWTAPASETKRFYQVTAVNGGK
jgi:hypothetical protein